MAPTDLVLITGTSGFIGFRTLVLTLKEGYRVRIAVRDESKAQQVLDNPAIKSLNLAPGTITSVIVPDFQAAGAFDEAVKDVKFILHLASPIPRGLPANADADEYIVKPAVRGTMAMLESANKSPTVKRIVITSSVVALIPSLYIYSKTLDTVVDAQMRTAMPDEYWKNPFTAYGASKVAALNEAEAWIKEQHPNFDVIHIHPGYVHGRNDLATTPEEANTGTNGNILNIALGTKATAPKSGGAVDVEDVARIHVASLDSKVPGNQSFLLAKPIVWQQVPSIIAKHFPDAVKQGIVTTEGVQPTLPTVFDVWKTEQTFGPLRDLEEQTTSIVGQYIQLKQKIAA